MEIIEKRRLLYSLVPPLFFVGLISIIKLLEFEFSLDFSEYGILPRSLSGLKGIFIAPLIHSNFNHLFNNAIPLLILGWSLFYFYRQIAMKVSIWSFILAGLYTWISARAAYHIGASGLVYALFGFLLISGFIRKNTSLIALSFLTAFLYGSLIWGILPWDHKISWEGHFWGLFVGLVLAIFYRKQGPQAKKYDWEEEEDLGIMFEETSHSDSPIVYHFIPKKEVEGSTDKERESK